MKRPFAWCLGLGAVIGIGGIVVLGVSPWTLALAALLLLCPAVLLWAAQTVLRSPKGGIAADFDLQQSPSKDRPPSKH